MGLPSSVRHLLVVSTVPFIFPEVAAALPVARCFNGGCWNWSPMRAARIQASI
jgi:hypothetical protein